MGIPYPKTFPQWDTGFPAANDNLPGKLIKAANDNKKFAKTMWPQVARRALRKMSFADARLNFAVKAISLTWDFMSGELEPDFRGDLYTFPGGFHPNGFDLYADFGRPPHFNVPGNAGNGYAWPNVTLGTTFNYPFALAGYTGTPGVYDPTYVPEFQNVSGFGSPDEYFSVWHSHGLEDVSGNLYWRVSSSQTWVRQAGSTNPIPKWWPLSSPEPLPVAPPMRIVREYSKVFRDVHGQMIRGPAPLPRIRPAPRPAFPKPPGPHVKERKFAVSIQGLGSAIINAATESADFIKALYQALPEGLRNEIRRANGGYVGPLQQAEALYRHINEIDVPKALGNLLKEQMEDRFFGQIGRLTAKANRLRGMPGGLELGPALEGVRFTVK